MTKWDVFWDTVYNHVCWMCCTVTVIVKPTIIKIRLWSVVYAWYYNNCTSCYVKSDHKKCASWKAHKLMAITPGNGLNSVNVIFIFMVHEYTIERWEAAALWIKNARQSSGNCSHYRCSKCQFCPLTEGFSAQILYFWAKFSDRVKLMKATAWHLPARKRNTCTEWLEYRSVCTFYS